ncbi:MAG: hypothetical protein RLZZ580_3239 [Cyanobacteriota bacterium]
MTILLTSFAPWLCHHCSNSSDDLLVSIQDNYAKKLLFLRQLPVNTHRASERVIVSKSIVKYRQTEFHFRNSLHFYFERLILLG